MHCKQVWLVKCTANADNSDSNVIISAIAIIRGNDPSCMLLVHGDIGNVVVDLVYYLWISI